MDGATDDELIRMYRSGDMEAFDTLFDRYHASVYAFARTMLGADGGPDEVLQEAFLAVARTARTYTPRGRFRSWLMRIARNRCLNRIEAVRARRAALARSGLNVAEIASEDAPPPRQLEADEHGRIVRAAIAALPDRQREAIALHAFEQMSYREIAEVMEMPIGTVKTLIHRARADLARALDAYEREAKRGVRRDV
jgi:RNA polymerase sigma-70 factor (ECF subfamily)